MAIHTSAITYSRGVPKNYSSFFFVSQANNVIPVPTRLYLQQNTLYNRNIAIGVSRRNTYPWR
jgi:hypothetical protein